MYDAAVVFCTWVETMPWAVAIRASSWMYPVILWVHFVGLSLWLATCLSVDLRLIGVGPRGQAAAELSEGLFVLNWIGFGVAFLGGFLLWSAEATVYVTNASFNVKLALLPLALIWHVVVQKKTPAWTQPEPASAIGQWAGLLELLLWISVVTASVGFLLTNAVTHA
jgi:hypothetical protein